MKHKRKEKIKISRMLWERKYFYLIGYAIGMLGGILSWIFGTDVKLLEMIIVPISVSFPFGFLAYLAVKEPERMKKEGRYILFSQEGLINFALSFGSLIVLGVLYKILSFIV